MTSSVEQSVTSPRAGEFYSRHRGGGLFTETVNQRIASYLCVGAWRLGLAPTTLTLTNLGLGLVASTAVIVLSGPMAAGDVPAWLVGVCVLLLWQLAYSLDCADGQLARVTGRASPMGGRVDVLADVATQIARVAAISSVADSYRPATPTWLVAAFAGTWMVNLVTSVLQQGAAAGSLVTSSSSVVRLAKLIRDYGAGVVGVGIVLAVVPSWTFVLMAVFTVVNGGFLLASVAAAARSSLRP